MRRLLTSWAVQSTMPNLGPTFAVDPGPEALAALLALVAAERDRPAFTALFTHLTPRLKAFYQHRGLDAGSAEDLTQETMLRIWHRADQFDPSRAAPAAWVFGIARNLRADMLRRERRVPSELDLLELYAPPERSPEAAAICAQHEVRLREALGELPAMQREAVRAAFLDGLPHSEAHQALGIALGTLKSHLRRALIRLRATMNEVT